MLCLNKMKKAFAGLLSTLYLASCLPLMNVDAVSNEKYTKTGKTATVDSSTGLYTIDGLPVINKTFSVNDNYVPKNLVQVEEKYFSWTDESPPKVDKDAYDAFKKLSDGLYSDTSITPPTIKGGSKVLTITSAYRSINEQASIYNSRASSEGSDAADKTSSRPGHSDHHTGRAIDVLTANSSKWSTDSYKKLGEWLKENCNQYGFIIRYPEGKQSITGYSHEPWHLTYIGDKQKCEAIAKAGSLEEYLGITSVYDSNPEDLLTDTKPVTTETSTKSNAEQALENESQVKAELENPEQVLVDKFSISQKESYMILANKFMNQTELKAMEWNLILSQFAIPYCENIQDVWNHKSFKEMQEKGLEVVDNPYIKTLAEGSKGQLDLKSFADALKDNEENVQTNMAEIAQCMKEDGAVKYSMVYVGDGSPAYISDLFRESTVYLYVKDKVAVTGDANSATDLWTALEKMQSSYLLEQKTKEELAKDVTAGSTIYDLEIPVWINTDSTLMYNAIYVANAIRIGGYGTYENFMNSVKNSQLYMDRWGNLCANCKIGGEFKYVIVYPAYSNPLFTSTEINDNDYAGYVYDDFTNEDFWKEVSGDSGSDKLFTINPETVVKTYGQMKEYISDSIDGLDKNSFLGDTSNSNKTMQSEYAISPITGKYFGNIYTRLKNSFNQKIGLIPILECDTTNNMVFNKAILSAYTRDNFSAVVPADKTKTSYYKDNWYDCFQDTNSSYKAFIDFNQYSRSDTSALFSNNLVFDRYNTTMLMKGSKDSKTIGVHAFDSKGQGYLVESGSISIGLQKDVLNMTGKLSSSSISFILKDQEDGLKVVDTANSSKDLIALYPFMQMHSYRKGLYSKTPSLQPTKVQGGYALNLNKWFEDRYISQSWTYENMITYKSDKDYDTDKDCKKLPIEIYWNAMVADSDKFRTYAVFNYTQDMIPDNSVLYGLSNRLSKSNQGSTYYVSHYLDKVNNKSYMTLSLITGTLDTASSWGVWEDSAKSMQKGLRDRPLPTEENSIDSNFFSEVTSEDNNGGMSIRYLLRDQRVSDVLESYPLEDITLLSAVWRNYYTPQTPFRLKLNKINAPDTAKSDAEEVKEDYSLIDDTTFNIKKDSFFGFDIALTPFNAVSADSNDVNNTLIWTNACSREQESKLSPGEINAGGSVLGIGEINSLNVGLTTIHRVSYNFDMLLLAVNKNTQGDNLTFLVEGYDASTEFNTDDILSNVATFFEHPITSFTNIILGFFQKIHMSVAMGNIGNIFDISWVLDGALAKNILIWYICGSVVICCINIIIRGSKFILSKRKDVFKFLSECATMLCLSTVPVILINYLSIGLSSISREMTRGVAGKLAMVEIEREVSASDSLNINFETFYTAFKEQFNDISDDYNRLSLKVPVGWDSSTNTLKYDTVTIKELYDEVEYSNILSKSNLEATRLEAIHNEELQDDKFSYADVYGEQQVGMNVLYYSYDEFVPVNYEKYSSNLFYYFYDYVKYQYLSYWASQTSEYNEAFSNSARKFTSLNSEYSETNKHEKWSEYINRMWDAERYMLEKSYNGSYLMYHDDDYVYNKQYDDSGKQTYRGAYVTDMFGLSYLFNMTDMTKESEGFVGAPNGNYINLNNDTTGIKNQMEDWKQGVQDEFLKHFGSFSDYGETTISKERRNKNYLVRDFYPIAYLMDSPLWDNLCLTNSAICKKPRSNDFSDYCFTPTYLDDYFRENKLYEGYADLSTVTSKDSSLSFNNIAGKRIPWRVYGSRSALFNSTYNGDKVSKDTTALEELLMECNKNIYDKVKDATEYMKGDIRDSSLIFTTAIIATMEFNKTFSPWMFSKNQLEPQNFTEDSMDLDKFMRVTFAEDMNSIVKNTNVIYMLGELDGGIVIVIYVVLSEIALFITMLSRILILIMLLLGSAYWCFYYFIHNKQEQRHMFLGLVSQFLNLICSQICIIYFITNGLNFIAICDNAFGRMLFSLVFLLVNIAITMWSLYMLKALFKNYKEFGGTVIQGSLNSAKTKIDSTVANIRNTVTANNSKINVAVGTITNNITSEYSLVSLRRQRNSERLEHFIEDNTDNSKVGTKTWRHKRKGKFNTKR